MAILFNLLHFKKIFLVQSFYNSCTLLHIQLQCSVEDKGLPLSALEFLNNLWWLRTEYEYGARIFKRLWSPGIDSKE
jgi:hypothetical protein